MSDPVSKTTADTLLDEAVDFIRRRHNYGPRRREEIRLDLLRRHQAIRGIIADGVEPIAFACPECGERFYGPHDCAKAREARALFEAAKRANDPDSRRAIYDLAYQAAQDAESV